MNFRVLSLPAGLKPITATCLAALVRRDQPSDANCKVYLRKNFAFDGDPPASYQLLASMSKFAWAGYLTAEFLAAAAPTSFSNPLPVLPPEAPVAEPFPLVSGLSVQLDGPDLVLDEITDFDAINGTILVFVETEIMALAAAALTGPGAYDLTVVRGFWGSTVADHAANTPIFIIRRDNIVPMAHPSFQPGNISELKIALGVQTLADAALLTFNHSSGLMFTGVVPDTFYPMNVPGLELSGAGFLASGINAIKIDDGLGNSYTWTSDIFTIDSDTLILCADDGSAALGTYTIYYSIDAGANWITTGLQVTCITLG
jgi:hypothetical protein